ncbi:MAG: tetratricopeptide repeat protein [Nitrospirota bacterium]|nr:tetratricopeptide repeat protein [Nitrospirota bacterium]
MFPSGRLNARWHTPLHLLLLALVCLGVYANGYHHVFQLDSSHVLEDNPSVRSLGNIPSYFTDPGTFSVLYANVDYRPVLQVTYALNYWLGGYHMPWWHFTQILLHFLCAVGIYLLCRRVIALSEPEHSDGAWIPLAAGLLFALHPTASGVVNYLSARSSLLTAAFLLPSILLYMDSLEGPHNRLRRAMAALLYTLALFSKIEAVGCLAVYFMFEMWHTARTGGHRNGFFRDLAATLTPSVLRRLAPFLAATAAYLAIRAPLMARFPFGDSREGTGIGNLDYLYTQLVVWWAYVGKWFAPVDLVADQGNYPVYRSLLEPTVLVAAGGWALVTALLITGWQKRPHQAVLAISALALLSPTSSILPLAEMLNEHRPYLPIGILSLVWIIPAARAAERMASESRGFPLYVPGLVALLCGLGALTFDRNRVFLTTESYWLDVIEKAPSARAYVNYGLTRMTAGEIETAQEYFLKAQEMSPNWHIVHINLAVTYREQGRLDLAEQYYNRAVESDTFTGGSLSWRGEYRLTRGRYAEALADFLASQPKSLEHYRNAKGAATAFAGLGDAQNAFVHTARCLKLNAEQTGRDIVVIAEPFFTLPSGAAPGLAYFQKLAERLPDTWWVHANISTLAFRLGQNELGQQADARAQALKG